MVITIHTEPLAELSEQANFILVHYLARVAVPFFIVCTGFFTGRKLHFGAGTEGFLKEDRIAILKSAWKVFRLYLICALIYLLLSIPDWIKTGWFGVNAFIDWGLAFFLHGSYYHLWYLIEVCYALIVLVLILPVIRKPFIYILAAVLWIVEVLDYGYRFLLPDHFSSVFRNFDYIQAPFEGVVRVLPLLLVGIVIQRAGNKHLRTNAIGLAVSAALLLAEIVVVRMLGGEQYSYLFFTLPLAYFLFGTVHHFDAVIHATNTVVYADVSTFVYCAHPAFILLINTLFTCPNWLMFIIVASASVAFGFLYYHLKRWIRVKR